MRTLLTGLALVGASVLLAAAAFWLLRGARRPASEAGPTASAPVRTSGDTPGGMQQPAEPGAHRARTGLPFLQVVQDPEDPGGDEAGDFSWPLREPPQVDGPLIESHYASGQSEFLGRQVRAADGSWVRDGPWTAWYENGQVCELGAYRAGVEDGPWQWWYEDGTRMAEGRWIDGARVGEWTFWYENGALGMAGSYVDGEGSGLWTLYHENGWKCAEGPWANGAPNGHWSVWNEDGTLDLERSGTYVDGEKVD